MNGFIYALGGTGFTFLMTVLGAAVVFFFKSDRHSDKAQSVFLGFASGVMIAASVWSLLIPAIDEAERLGKKGWIPASFGFMLGVVFLMLLDKLIPYFRPEPDREDCVKNGLKRTSMLIFAITLHNIPEGMAVGVAFGALQNREFSPESLMGAITIAVGIGLQNFPEGAAVSVPLRREGFSRKKSFFIGQASGLVEPIAGVIGALLVVYIESFLPYALAFAAGSMILVAVHELIPECQQNKKTSPYFATMGIVSGFAVMMLLDVMLG